MARLPHHLYDSIGGKDHTPARRQPKIVAGLLSKNVLEVHVLFSWQPANRGLLSVDTALWALP